MSNPTINLFRSSWIISNRLTYCTALPTSIQNRALNHIAMNRHKAFLSHSGNAHSILRSLFHSNGVTPLPKSLVLLQQCAALEIYELMAVSDYNTNSEAIHMSASYISRYAAWMAETHMVQHGQIVLPWRFMNWRLFLTTIQILKQYTHLSVISGAIHSEGQILIWFSMGG